MPDPTYSEAMEDALASAAASTPIIPTLSLYYEGLVDGDGMATDIFVYLGFEGDRENADGIPLKDFRLETGAARKGGQVVEFISVPFRVVLPDMTNATTPKGKLILDGVGREISEALLAAIEAGVAVEVTYREYIGGLEDDGPQNDPPTVFNLQNVTIDSVQVSGDIGIGSFWNRKFPSVLYDSDVFPALTA